LLPHEPCRAGSSLSEPVHIEGGRTLVTLGMAFGDKLVALTSAFELLTIEN
jgi:hypothetical protein